MKVLVTGSNGQLGSDLIKELIKRKHQVIGVDKGEVDITNRESVFSFIAKEKPEAVIHCAGWTAVDLAEDQENKDLVMSINYSGTKNIAEICKKIDCKMIYISTDYVFSGEGDTPWEPENVGFNPLNYYGYTKYLGEQAVSTTLNKFFIVRIAWLFGKNGKNFVNTMLGLSKKVDSIKVVNDQIGTPTYTLDLSRILADMVVTEKYGTYHVTNEGGYISWYDFASEIFRLTNKSTKVISVTTAEYGLSKAKRPSNSRLDKSKLTKSGFDPLPNWDDALKRYLIEIGEIDE